ncbi:hypothetical protein [Geomonas azotofigens]|uniref:hypothetical protein n=1 Tax=Geomonas azotofigens TaxID=2843196 RepID=UPI001C12361C|nr:hypothetical protein [Geomonas azotofigens]MBU5614459.1 hypothetical protein [Geomonas azotofigens]
MTFALVELAAGNDQEYRVDVGTRGEAARIRVLEPTDDVMMTVYGKGYCEVGEQFVLSCLKRITVQRLKELHKTPLRKAATLTLVKG